MELAINILIGTVALIHCFILWFEMFAWKTKARKMFKNLSQELFDNTVVLAANQGLYNGFLAAGLIWTFFIDDVLWRTHISLFFLSCILIAGIYGSLTASKKIIYVQALPALITILLILANQHM